MTLSFLTRICQLSWGCPHTPIYDFSPTSYCVALFHVKSWNTPNVPRNQRHPLYFSLIFVSKRTGFFSTPSGCPPCSYLHTWATVPPIPLLLIRLQDFTHFPLAHPLQHTGAHLFQCPPNPGTLSGSIYTYRIASVSFYSRTSKHPISNRYL